MFISIRMEDRFPITDTLYQTPAIPDNCQWALFLRNHDELTLEMVTAEERSFMYRTYARERRARINLGIRRRLAPLLQSDRKQIELLNGLLFSLPGTPVIYYGDEIGMGDNIYLGDRDGVRTPMQWSPDRNAGFSRANPQQIFLPVVIDPEYHYEALNVETQHDNPHSLLRWMKHLIAARRRYRAFSRGSLTFLYPENRKVLVFVRQYEDEHVMVVANLAHSIQCVEIDLSAFRGRSPVELFDRTVFPPISELPYFLTLGPHAFYWFALEPQRMPHLAAPSLQEDNVPTLTVAESWQAVLSSGRVRSAFEEMLPRYLKQRRWFVGQQRGIRSVEIQEAIPMPYKAPVAYLTIVQVEYSEGDSEMYAIPFTFATGEQEQQIWRDVPLVVAANLHVEQTGEKGILYDALWNNDFATLLLESVARHRSFRGDNSEVMAYPIRSFQVVEDLDTETNPAALPVTRPDSSNTTIVYGERFLLKFFRRIESGINPDLEIGRFLTRRVSLARVPVVYGALDYHRRNSDTSTLSVVHEFISNQGNAWQYTQDELRRYFERVLSYPGQVRVLSVPLHHPLELADEPISALANELINSYLGTASLLGQRTAELHVALAQDTNDPEFAPEPFTDFFQRPFYHAALGLMDRDLRALEQQLNDLPRTIRDDVRRVINAEQQIRACFVSFRDRKMTGMRMRCHGNYHLGEVLRTSNDFVITDFEGEPARSLDERRIKVSPLRDVASMIRSFHAAVYEALLTQASRGINPHTTVEQVRQAQLSWTRFWYTWVSARFLRGYLDTINQAPLLLQTRDEFRLLLDVYLLERMLHEINYEVYNRLDRLTIPIQGILQVLESRAD